MTITGSVLKGQYISINLKIYILEYATQSHLDPNKVESLTIGTTINTKTHTRPYYRSTSLL